MLAFCFSCLTIFVLFCFRLINSRSRNADRRLSFNFSILKSLSHELRTPLHAILSFHDTMPAADANTDLFTLLVPRQKV